MNEISRRRVYTLKCIDELKKEVETSKSLLSSNGCVYMTGSFGRLEASEGSDVDTFIACCGNTKTRKLTGLEEIRVKSNLIEAVDKLELPEFDGDGDYLRAFPEEELIASVGSRTDDYENTFTARLLLLLEAKPLIGNDFFDSLRRKIVDRYWTDFKGHENDFVPAFFCNDVLRLWRTFCVNYEARTSEETPEKKKKRRSKNYKLRHTRIMTCYSALAMLAYRERQRQDSSPEFAIEIFKKTPIERLKYLRDKGLSSATLVLERYEDSLKKGASPDFVDGFIEDSFNLERRKESRFFSESVYELMIEAGDNTKILKRILV